MATFRTFDVWGGVTNPSEHNPGGFRYLIHRDTGMDRLGEGRAADKSSCFAANPAAIASRACLSTSLIDESHQGLHMLGYSHGFIVEVPGSAIIATWHEDMRAIHTDPARYASEFPPTEADDVLADTDKSKNNEIIISGRDAIIAGVLWFAGLDSYHPGYDLKEIDTIASDQLRVPLIILGS